MYTVEISKELEKEIEKVKKEKSVEALLALHHKFGSSLQISCCYSA
jgi:hypothetical protein